MSRNLEKLIDHILPLSKSTDFEIAKNEWNLDRIEYVRDFDNCPCGQRIREVCHITNKTTRNNTYVGNVCINRFLGIETGNIFNGLKKIEKDINANPNEDLIKYIYDKDLITSKERRFLLETKNKRNLSDKQLCWKVEINTRVLKELIK